MGEIRNTFNDSMRRERERLQNEDGAMEELRHKGQKVASFIMGVGVGILLVLAIGVKKDDED